jgi:heat shock protein HslJ
MPRRMTAAGLLMLAGCAASPPLAGTLAGPAWTLESIAGEAPARPSTLRFEEGRLAGQGPCNRYAGAWRIEGGALSIGPLVATRMACPEPAMAQEARLLRLLDSARLERLTADRLEIIGADGARLVARR